MDNPQMYVYTNVIYVYRLWDINMYIYIYIYIIWMLLLHAFSNLWKGRMNSKAFGILPPCIICSWAWGGLWHERYTSSSATQTWEPTGKHVLLKTDGFQTWLDMRYGTHLKMSNYCRYAHFSIHGLIQGKYACLTLRSFMHRASRSLQIH